MLSEETPAPVDGRATKTRLSIPSNWADWLGPTFRGCVRFERAFGMPTGLDDQQQIDLVIEQVDYRAEIWLGETHLGSQTLGQPPFRHSIRSLMQARNLLRLDIELPLNVDRGPRSQMAGGLIGEVRLEISQSQS